MSHYKITVENFDDSTDISEGVVYSQEVEELDIKALVALVNEFEK